MKPGPPLEDLMRYTANCPSVYLDEPFYQGIDENCIHTAALINDRLLIMGFPPLQKDELSIFDIAQNEINTDYLKMIALLSYLLGYPWFSTHPVALQNFKPFIFSPDLKKLSKQVKTRDFLEKTDRREEICRMTLMRLNLYPQGENENMAKDRLITLDSLEQARIIKKSLEAQERAREIREAMERKRAAEAASKMMRE